MINNKYRKENNPTPESMLWLDYHAETGLGSHADMSKLVIHAQGYVPSLQVQGFTGTEGTLPSPLNMKDISETQRYKAPSTGIHIAGPTWADNRPLYVRVHSGEAIRTATYLVVGVFTPSSSEHAPEVVVKTVVNGNAVRVASHYSAQALDVFVVQLTKGTAPFTVEATLDVGGILGTCLRDSYRFAVALAIASLFIARIGVFTETRSTLYTVLVQSPALMIALGTSLLLLLGKHLRPVDALRDIGLGELLMATALSNALAVLVEAAALAVVGAAKALNRLLPGVGGNRLVMGIVLSLPSFCSIVAAAVCLAETIENRTRTGKGAVGKLARHTLRLLVIPAALSAIEAATATSAAQLFLKGLVLDGYKLVALAAVLGCTFAKTGLEKMKAPYSVFSLVTVAIGVAIAVFGTNEYCTACVVAVWANILI